MRNHLPSLDHTRSHLFQALKSLHESRIKPIEIICRKQHVWLDFLFATCFVIQIRIVQTGQQVISAFSRTRHATKQLRIHRSWKRHRLQGQSQPTKSSISGRTRSRTGNHLQTKTQKLLWEFFQYTGIERLQGTQIGSQRTQRSTKSHWRKIFSIPSFFSNFPPSVILFRIFWEFFTVFLLVTRARILEKLTHKLPFMAKRSPNQVSSSPEAASLLFSPEFVIFKLFYFYFPFSLFIFNFILIYLLFVLFFFSFLFFIFPIIIKINHQRNKNGGK